MGDRFQTMSTAIATSYLFLRDAQRGAVTGVLLLAIAAAVVVGSSMLARRLGGARS
jgi:putative spermidine/putrescine transport system permease protein